MEVHKAVVLAAGMGSRMQAASAGASLTPAQRRAADAGLKGLMPFEVPFLDYLVAALAQAGVEELCLVVAPGSDELRRYAAGARAAGPRVTVAVQPRPRGTADALLAARDFTGDDDFLVLNSDTYYPPLALSRLLALDGWGLLVVERDAAASDPTTHLTPERLAAFALVEVAQGDPLRVRALEEKPGRTRLEALPGPVYLSVNCWRFGPAIYRCCSHLAPSPRGELELPAAALAAVASGARIRLVPTSGVLDLSTREDVAEVARLLPPWPGERHAS